MQKFTYFENNHSIATFAGFLPTSLATVVAGFKVQRKALYNAGQSEAAFETDRRIKAQGKNAVQDKATTGKKVNGVTYEGNTADKKLSNVQKASIKGVESIATMSPSVNIHVYESYMKDGKRVCLKNGKEVPAPNGWFIPGTNEIWIDINAGNLGEGVALYTVSHEISHLIRDWNAAEWKNFADFLMENYGKDGVDTEALIARKEATARAEIIREGKKMPGAEELYDRAYEEVVCDAMAEMFADPNSYVKLAELKKTNLTLWEKIKEVIGNMLKKLKDALGVYSEYTPDAVEAQLVRKFSAEVYNQLQDLYLKAFVGAEANMDTVNGIKPGAAEFETVNSERDETQTMSELRKPITAQDIQILRSIGKKSVNAFTFEDIQKSQKWAYKFYKELGVKSPFFRAWFGDWREHDTNETGVIIYKGEKAYSAGRETNRDTGTVISWGNDFVKETRNHQSNKTLSIQMIPYIADIVKNAVYINSRVSENNSKTKMKNTAFIHDFYCIASLEGKQYLYKLFVEQALSGNEKEIFSRAYQLKQIEKVAELSNGVLSFDGGLTEDNSATTISISNLYTLVKRFDKNFTAAPKVSPALLNADGSPKVVYHGTDYKFSEFKPRDGLNEFFFTDNSEAAKDYGEIVMPVYLHMVNPYIVDFNGEGDSAIYDAIDYAKTNNYDGVIAKNAYDGANTHTEYVVFEKDYIKHGINP